MAHRVGGLARRSRQFGGARTRHRHNEVEAVEKRPRELVPKRGEPLRRALAIGRGVATSPARAEVHRGHELEARREHGSPAHSRDADNAVLEWLAERLERRPPALGEHGETEPPTL